MTDVSADVHARVRGLSDEEFFSMLLRSVDARVVEGTTFPSFPDDQLQANFVGSSGKDALNEAYNFWRVLKSKTSALGRPLGETSNVLDFGCGWGRYLRFLNKDTRADHLHGVDVNPEIVALCKRLGVAGNVKAIEALGSLPFPDDFFDVAMAYSVFTHLPENVHIHWMREMTRVSRKGAVCVMTLEPRRFIEFVRDETPKGTLVWHQCLAKFAPGASEFLRKFDAGEVVYLPTGGGPYRPASTYGDAVVPMSWIAKNWSGWAINEYIDDKERFWRGVLVLQKL